MLFRRADLEGIAAGEITLAFRRWRRPLARAGSTQVTAIGVLWIESVETVDPDAVSDEDLRRAGRPDRASLVAEGPDDGALCRMALRLEGPDPRIALREDTALGGADRAARTWTAADRAAQAIAARSAVQAGSSAAARRSTPGPGATVPCSIAKVSSAGPVAPTWRAPLEAPPIRVLVADDDPLVTGFIGLVAAHEPGIDVVGTAADADEAIELARLCRPQVVVLDLYMPRGGGPRAAARPRSCATTRTRASSA